MTWLFILLAVLAFLGFGLQAVRRNAHGMAYAAAVFCFWVIAALWWSGRL